MKLLPLLIAPLFILFSFNATASTGCLSSNTAYTYINPEGKLREGVPSYFHRYEADRLLSTSTYCVVNTGSPCYIYATRSGYSSSPGTLVEYNSVNNCPIDDYTGIMMVGFGIIGFAAIRKTGIAVSKS
jgi:hypothetical protein